MNLDDIKCSFCGKSRKDVSKLISGPKVYICNECVTVCNNLLLKEDFNKSISKYKPITIYNELEKYVIGQNQAKKYLSVAIYNHYKRLDSQKNGASKNIELTKGNILLIGPTGTGKTLLVETLAQKLDVPLAIGDATTLTEAGYVGEDVESLIKNLYQSTDGDIEKTGRGIIFIDEIDKLAKRGSSSNNGRDVSGEGVQQALLKLLEGKTITFSPNNSKLRKSKNIKVDTTNILFILSGSFNSIEEIVKRRIGNKGMGFGATVKHEEEDKNLLRSKIQNQDLFKYGMIPEFMGRVPIIVTVDDLTVDNLEEILWKPKNSLIAQYKKMFSLENIELVFAKDSLREIAEESYKRKMGARGLKAIMEDIMLDIMYEIPSMEKVHKCIVDKMVVKQRTMPHIEYKAKVS
ncbi:MAG: ATP-dependent Clp protease ATP-binding subunit ClpX [Deltaproteobacteria bacterium]|jgi:ATP-dependent Clp protease ATP-binding subunit ClpX|nr:ATP-dependent Clp protease ATP-binding subunit ClpX [Deltaproteobacteria bacterium]